jgi:hypothetical protein
MTLPSGRTLDYDCIYKLLLGAKHGDSGQDNVDWQDSCQEQTVLWDEYFVFFQIPEIVSFGALLKRI